MEGDTELLETSVKVGDLGLLHCEGKLVGNHWKRWVWHCSLHGNNMEDLEALEEEEGRMCPWILVKEVEV